MKIIIEIPKAKIAEFQEGFKLAVQRNPEHEGMDDKQFLKQWIKDSIENAYRTGKILKARSATKPTIEQDLVKVTLEDDVIKA